jgi:hypothetical protein
MKTSKVINLLTTAISGCYEAVRLINGFEHDDDGKIIHTHPDASPNTGYTNATMIMSAPSEFVRDLYHEVPASLKTESLDDKVKILYPHLMEKDWKASEKLITDLHAEIYKLWEDMITARDAYNLYDCDS